MSAEPPNPSGSPGRSRPHLSDLSRETTEEDLWNLDDEEAPAQPVKPRQPKPAPPVPASKEPVHTLDPTGAAEPPMPRGLTAPVKPLTPRSTSTADEIGDLDDDGEEQPEPTPVSAPKASPQEEVVALTSPIDEEPAPAPAAKVKPASKEPAPEPPVPQKPVEATPEPQADEEEEFEEHDEELLAKTSTRENRPRSAAPAAAKASLRPRLNRREVIGIATFAVVALIATTWMLTRFFTLLSFTRDSDSRPDYPLKGELVQIDSGTTFWREPVRSGDNRDVAKREVIMIPVLELTIDPGNSGGGSLRVIFRNADGEPVGDPITRSFAAGRFEGSGNASSSFAATDGFTEEGDFQAYRTGKGKLWTADVLEGPPGGTPASAFKKLSSIPIFPVRR